MPKPVIGLIAGGGRLPVLEAQGMRAAGYEVACVGLLGQHDADLAEHCDSFTVAGVLSLGKWARVLRRRGAAQAVMVGRVEKSGLMYHPMRWLAQMPSWRSIRIFLWDCRHNRRSQHLLLALANEMNTLGIELIDTTQYIPEHLASAGVLTSVKPTAQQQRDIAFGWPILMRMNDLDIGQAVTARNSDVIAVEAMEGTDQLIARSGELCHKPGWVLLKGAPASKDPRFDVPTIGEHTIENLAKAGAGCLAVAAGRVILVDKPKVLAAADRAGIAVVGVAEGGPTEP